MRYLLLMTLAGSTLFLLYGIWAIICGRFASQQLKYVLMVVILFVYVMPLMWLKGLYCGLLELFIQKDAVSGPELMVDMASISTEAEAYITPDYSLMITLAGIWAGIAIMIVLVKCILYMRLRRNLKRITDDCPDDVRTVVEKLRKEFHIKRKIDVVPVYTEESSSTIGLFKPIIILQKQLTGREMEWVLRHEAAHIARGDLWVKFLLELVCCLYWFNPILILFYIVFDAVCESSCDQKVVKGFTKEERAVYANIIIKSMKNRPGKRRFLHSAFAGNYKNEQERIKSIMNERKMKRWEKIVAVSIFVVFVLADSLIAFAYPNVYSVKEVVDDYVEVAVQGNNFWIVDDVEKGYGQPIFDVIYDQQFIDESGEITPVNLYQPNVLCIGHHWVSGYFQMHDKRDDGSCNVYTFYSDRCTRCNTIIVGDLYSSNYFPKCPH